jgi:hypothetical protein
MELGMGYNNPGIWSRYIAPLDDAFAVSARLAREKFGVLMEIESELPVRPFSRDRSMYGMEKG